MNVQLTRRRFVIGTAVVGGIGVLQLALPARQVQAADAASPVLPVSAWLALDTQGRVRLRVNSSDIGQGAQTGLAQLVADEMDLPFAQMDLEMAPVAPDWYVRDGSYFTGGSRSISLSFEPFRRLGASARAMLVSSAASQWQVPAAECSTAAGQVHHAKTGATLAYGALAEHFLKQPVPAEPALKPRERWSLIGQPVPRVDTPAKVRGAATYGIDFERPGLLNAALMAAPAFGARLASVDPAPALAVPGVVRIVSLDNAVAVVARKYWQAQKGLAALAPAWTEAPAGPADSAALSAALAAVENAADAEVYVPEGSTREQFEREIDARFARAARIVEATYEVPFLSHCPLEPMNATAEFAADGALTLWAPMQAQKEMRAALATALELPETRITLHTLPAGGGFGRRLKTDYGVYAAQVAREVKAPVKLIWSREEDMTHGHYRPATRTHLAAAVAADGTLLALRASGGAINDTAVGGLAVLGYTDVAVRCAQKAVKASVPVGAWRAVDATQNAFFVESLVDEVAAALERDPLEYRRLLLRDKPRELRLLDAAAERIGYGKPAPGSAHGVAFFAGWGSRVCLILDLGRDTQGMPKMHRAVAAFDCGTAVNPDAVRAQVEGGITMGLSAALHEAIHIADGRVVEQNFDGYRLLRNGECPEIEVILFDSPDVPPGGAGEPPLPPAAPALANAWARLTGQRIRRLPLLETLRASA
jgi:isoquinoline 1-oxidoreductase beta subunit